MTNAQHIAELVVMCCAGSVGLWLGIAAICGAVLGSRENRRNGSQRDY
jgi:hypothetical protein